jgi:hypothetical protein
MVAATKNTFFHRKQNVTLHLQNSINNVVMAKANKETRGGADRGQGRKDKYGEPTTTFSVRVPVSKKSELSAIVTAALKRWLRK